MTITHNNLYFSIHGSDKDGWRLNVYQYGNGDWVIPHSAPKEFNTIEELADELDRLRNI